MTDDELKTLLEGMRQDNVAAHAETRLHTEAVSEAMRRHVDAATETTRRHVDTATETTRRHVDVAGERTQHEIRLIAESVVLVTERLTFEATEIRDEMRGGFAATQSMIKFSHKELDRRVTALEEAVSDLQSRMERLEDSAH